MPLLYIVIIALIAALITAVLVFILVTFRKRNRLHIPEKYHGLWHSSAYSSIFEITHNAIITHQLTDIGCIVNKEPYVSHDDNDAVYLYDYQLERATPQQLLIRSGAGYSIRTEKLEQLPSACIQDVANTPENNFEIFWQSFQRHYAFFPLYGVDWQQSYDTYRPQVNANTSEEQLFKIFHAMLEPLKDGHISLNATIAGKERDYTPGRSPVWFDAARELISGIKTNYLDDMHRFANNRIALARLKQDSSIAYLNILSMGAFSKAMMHYPQENQALHEAMTTIMQTLKQADIRALVLDIRFNNGGSDALAGTIASYFMARAHDYAQKSYWYQGNFSEEQCLSVQPQGRVHFDKAVFLLTSGYSASAAEIFTLIMRALPQVTVIGEATAGEFSDIFSRKLPNGWEFGLSKERFRTMEGKNFESIGIPADKAMTITLEDITAGKDVMLEHILTTMQTP